MSNYGVENEKSPIRTPNSCHITCFLCQNTKFLNSTDFEREEDIRDKYYFTGSNGNCTLNRQLWNVFLVKKLLSVSESVCERILVIEVTNQQGQSEHEIGYNSNFWFSVCPSCSPSLEEGWKIYEQIVKLEGKLRELGSRLRGQIKESGEDNEMEEMVAVEKRIWESLLNKNGT